MHRFFLLVGYFAVAVATGCSEGSAPQNSRSYVTQRSPLEVESVDPFRHDPLASSGPGSCEAVNRLSQIFGIGRFALFSKLAYSEEGLVGALDARHSPFVQLYLAEKVEVPSNEVFYQKAKDEFQNGRLSAMKFRVLQASWLMPSVFERLKYKAVNDKIVEAFPGIYGEMSSVENSFYVSILKKVGFDPNQNQLQNQPSTLAPLLKDMPLFLNRLSGFPQDVEFALRSSLATLAAPNASNSSLSERVCAVVLLQRVFAQILSLKGYQRPELYSGPAGGSVDHAVVRPLSARAYPEFQTVSVGGIFVDGESQRVALSAEEVQGYDPNLNNFSVLGWPSDETDSSKPLAQSLAVLRALTSIYSATAPFRFSNHPEDYILGDVQAQNNRAVLPFEVHSLSMGLISMIMKNLAHREIVKVSAAGRRVTGDEKPAGVALLDFAGQVPRQKLEDLVHLLGTALELDYALARMSERSSAAWQSLHPFYTTETMVALKGLSENLRRLFLPLAASIKSMTASRLSCVGELEWDVSTGARRALRSCRPSEFDRAQRALHLLGRTVSAPAMVSGENNLSDEL